MHYKFFFLIIIQQDLPTGFCIRNSVGHYDEPTNTMDPKNKQMLWIPKTM